MNETNEPRTLVRSWIASPLKNVHVTPHFYTFIARICVVCFAPVRINRGYFYALIGRFSVFLFCNSKKQIDKSLNRSAHQSVTAGSSGRSALFCLANCTADSREAGGEGGQRRLLLSIFPADSPNISGMLSGLCDACHQI